MALPEMEFMMVPSHYSVAGQGGKEVSLNFRILLVDDEIPILDMLTITLKKEGFLLVETATSGREAEEKCRSWQPDFVVLDVMLPDLDGFEVCRRLRDFSDVPVLFLTARSSDLDKLTGFNLGGDDYVTKPFNPLEVVARIRAHWRRQQRQLEPGETGHRVYDMGRFQVHEASAELVVAGEVVPCPAREFQLLVFLCQHPNQVFSRAQLYERVWGETSLGDDNTVIVHIRRLREKIEEDPSNPRYLVTVRGLGYKLVPEDGAR
jgi:two-component system response regulator RegX3